MNKLALEAALRILKPRKAFAGWGDEVPQPLPLFRSPISDQQLWELCEAYMPEEVHSLIAAKLVNLLDQKLKPQTKPGPKSDIADEVERYCSLGWGPTAARRLVAALRSKPMSDVSRAHRRKY